MNKEAMQNRDMFLKNCNYHVVEHKDDYTTIVEHRNSMSCDKYQFDFDTNGDLWRSTLLNSIEY